MILVGGYIKWLLYFSTVLLLWRDEKQKKHSVDYFILHNGCLNQVFYTVNFEVIFDVI